MLQSHCSRAARHTADHRKGCRVSHNPCPFLTSKQDSLQRSSQDREENDWQRWIINSSISSSISLIIQVPCLDRSLPWLGGFSLLSSEPSSFSHLCGASSRIFPAEAEDFRLHAFRTVFRSIVARIILARCCERLRPATSLIASEARRACSRPLGHERVGRHGRRPGVAAFH